jgi:hypothetical protein
MDKESAQSFLFNKKTTKTTTTANKLPILLFIDTKYHLKLLPVIIYLLVHIYDFVGL